MAKILRVGIIGYGYATATFHAPLIAAVDGLELTAISSSDASKVHADWPQMQVCNSPEELLAREDIDLIVIPTPNDTHHSLAALALAAGKHVVVDKPFTLDANEAGDLIARAERAQKLISVFHNRRWVADFLTVQKLIASGQLGRITYFESHFDRFRPEVRPRWREGGGAGSGLWYDLGPHLLDQALCLFGLPQTIFLDSAKQRDGAVADDWFHAILSYGPLRVILHASVLVAHEGPRFIIHGTKGSYTKEGIDPQEDALKAGGRPGDPDWGVDVQAGRLDVLRGQWMQHSMLPNESGDYTRYYAAIRDAILHGAPNPVPPLEALRVMQLIDAGNLSAAQGRVISIEKNWDNASTTCHHVRHI
jgi:scyllo-inositol 2-dehydrogenase (NADP+)